MQLAQVRALRYAGHAQCNCPEGMFYVAHFTTFQLFQPSHSSNACERALLHFMHGAAHSSTVQLHLVHDEEAAGFTKSTIEIVKEKEKRARTWIQEYNIR